MMLLLSITSQHKLFHTRLHQFFVLLLLRLIVAAFQYFIHGLELQGTYYVGDGILFVIAIL